MATHHCVTYVGATYVICIWRQCAVMSCWCVESSLSPGIKLIHCIPGMSDEMTKGVHTTVSILCFFSLSVSHRHYHRTESV